jgi:hypothetical protein
MTCPGGLAMRTNASLLEPWNDQQRMKKTRAGNDCYQRAKQRPAGLQDKLVMDVLDGIEGDEREKEPGGDESSYHRIANGASQIEAP